MVEVPERFRPPIEVDANDPLPRFLVARCRVVLADGRSCGYFRKYRPIPKDVDTTTMTPEQVAGRIRRNVMVAFNDFFTIHVGHSHPQEYGVVKDKVDRAVAYLLVRYAGELAEFEKEY